MEEALREASRLSAAHDWAGVLEVLAPVHATEENKLELAYQLGLAHARLEHWDEALLFLEQVVTGSDELLKVCQCRLVLAYVYSVTGRSRLAEYELRRLLDSGFESVQTCAGLGYVAWDLGRADEAVDWYSKALELDQENPNALNGLGFVLAELGNDLKRALVCCRKAVEKTPNNPAYLDSLAWVYFKLGHAEEARAMLARALTLAPDAAEILDHIRAVAGDGAVPEEERNSW